MYNRLTKICFLFLVMIVLQSSLTAQNSGLLDSAQHFKYTFSQFGNETWSFIKQPTKWKAVDYVLPVATIFLTYEIMMNYDQPIRNAVLRDQKYFNSVPIEFGRMWGELYAPIALFGGFAIHSLLANDIGTRKIAYEIGQASLYAGAVTFLLKTAIGRARPYMEEGITSFHPFSSFFNQDDHSLPGGHMTAAMVLSTVLSRNSKPVWLKALAYLPAVLTCVSRVYQDKHWASDEFLGAVLGYCIASWVVDIHEENKSIIEMSSMYPLSIRIAL
jgi:membrane-associated phospholipid phosphatase